MTGLTPEPLARPGRFGDFGGRYVPEALIPASCVKVAESGVGGPEDAARFAGEGADAVLVGEALVRGSDPRRAAHELIAAGATP